MQKMSYFIIILLGCLFFFTNFFSIFNDIRSNKNLLHLYFWSNYIDESIIDDFEKETGIRVKYDEFDSSETLDAKVLSGTIDYDLIMPTANTMHRQINAYHVLDKTKIPNLRYASSFVQEKLKLYPDADKYSINFVWGTTGLGINLDEVKKIISDPPVESLAMIFDINIISKLSKCGVYAVDSADEIIPAALAYLGKDPNSTNRIDLYNAKKLILNIRTYIRKFTSSDYVSLLANGDACVVLGWSGDIMQAHDIALIAKNGVNISYYLPKEGSQMFFDQLAIPKNAKNKENAYKFINFILRPDINARIVNSLKYPTLLMDHIKENLSNETIQNSFLFLNEELLKRIYVLKNYNHTINKFINKMFMEIKLGRDRIE